MTPPAICIAPLQAVARLLTCMAPPVHVVGLLGPGMEHPALPVPEERRLRLSFHDVAGVAPGFTPPTTQHVRALLAFAQRWRAQRQGTLVIHCWMGVSRSPAAAYIVQCALRPQVDERMLARELRARAPFATPNPRLVALADTLLGRAGRMTAAIAAIGRGEQTAQGRPVTWPLATAEQTG